MDDIEHTVALQALRDDLEDAMRLASNPYIDIRVTVPDALLVHRWQCEICDQDVELGPDWYANNGTPVCTECDADMAYDKTYIKIKDAV